MLTLIGAEHNNGADMLGVSAGQVEALQIQSTPQSMLYYYGKEYIINIIATKKNMQELSIVDLKFAGENTPIQSSIEGWGELNSKFTHSEVCP